MNNPAQPNPYLTITSLLLTKREARETIVNLEQVLNSLFMVNQTLDYALTKYLPVALGKALKQYLLEKKLLQEPKELLRPALETLIEYIRGLRTISLTLGFHPSEAVLRDLALWVRENLGDGILLDYTVDRHIVAGAIIVYGGLYRDFSLNRLITDSLKKNKSAIEAVFR